MTFPMPLCCTVITTGNPLPTIADNVLHVAVNEFMSDADAYNELRKIPKFLVGGIIV